MTALDLDSIRAVLDRGIAATGGEWFHALRKCITEIEQLRAALRDVLALHRPVEVEPSDTICAACSSVRGTGDSLRYFPYTEWPCPTVEAITAHVDLS